MKIVTILGARPQFIKAGSVSREIAKHTDIQEVIVHTGQHYDANMSDVFFQEMQIPKPDYFLNVRAKNHGQMTGHMIIEIEKILLNEKPDFVLVYGDTNSTLAGAIATSKLNIKLVHIEAGLRSFNMKMPEEVNRILTDRVSSLLFCPTQEAVQNLKKEGFGYFDCEIINCGDVMQDGINFYKQFCKKPYFDVQDEFILCTIHRAENTDDRNRLQNIFKALVDISKICSVVLPLHPRTKKIIHELGIDTGDIQIVEPVGYLEMVWLLEHCQSVMTDSGGLQKEAYMLKKPCITLRDETEWNELVENKFNVLVGADTQAIIQAFQRYEYNTFDEVNLYGMGNASEIIIQKLREF